MSVTRWFRIRRFRLRVGLASGIALTIGVMLVQAISSSPSLAVQFCNTTPILGPETITPGSGTGPASPYPSAITVSGLTGTITDVNVTIYDFRATYAEDADVLLSSPTTVNSTIMSDVGGDNDNEALIDGVNLTLDDQAANPLPADTVLQSGTFRPVNDNDDPTDGLDAWPAPAPAATAANSTLGLFNGLEANGTWNLWLTDDFSGVESTIFFEGGWCLDIITATSGTATSSTTTSSTTTSTTSTTTTTSTTSTSTTTTTTTPPAGDCGVTAVAFKTATWTVDQQQQVRVTAKNLGTTRARCRVTLSARRISPTNGPNAADYPEKYVVTLNPGASALAYFYVTPPVPGTYRVTGCARSINNTGAVNDTARSNDCKSARRTAS